MEPTSRRRFCLQAIGGGAITFSLSRWQCGSIQAKAAQRTATDQRLQPVSRSSRALGTEVAVTVYHDDRGVAERALTAAMDEIETVENVMSLYRPDSELCRLNHDGTIDRPHPYMVDVLRCAEAVSRRTEGAFDVTVQPLWDLYSDAVKAKQVPAQAQIDSVRKHVDWRRVKVLPGQIRLRGRETKVTLNGIAQGFAADRVAEALRRCGIRHALMNTGEMNSVGGKPGGQPWMVGIQHPRQKDAYVEVAAIESRALATSGDYATTFSEDLRANHLFDPRTGRSPQTFASVSVAAMTACEADALATAAFVLGPEKGLQLLRATPGADGLLVFKDGSVLMTRGFPVQA